VTVGRVVATVAVAAAAPLIAAAPAQAVSAPPIDDRLLPAPSPARPPEATEQREPCADGGSRRGHDIAAAPDILGLRQAWNLTRGAGQSVAVIDTGVARHRLLPRLVAGGDFVHTGDGTSDCDGHGTLVAGIIAAAPGVGGFSGVAPEAAVIAIRQSSNKFGPTGGAGSGYGDVQTLAMAVRAAADLGATVINISTVACLPAADAPDDRALGAALAYAVDVKNAVVIAAAGNVGGAGQCTEQNPTAPGAPDWDDVRTVVSPAWYDDLVLTVGSVDRRGAASSFTLAGPWVDVAAPGEAVVSLSPDGDGLVDTLPDGDRDTPIAGTSYAAPVVSGIAALVRARWPQLTARQVVQRIEDTAHRPSAGWDPVIGAGVVDASAALSAGLPATPAGHDALPAPAPEAPHDGRPQRIALRGTAICALLIGMAALSASVTRSRVPKQ
jgi:membrane-anchored mycosin MYCP